MVTNKQTTPPTHTHTNKQASKQTLTNKAKRHHKHRHYQDYLNNFDFGTRSDVEVSKWR